MSQILSELLPPTHTLWLQGEDPEAKRQQILNYFTQTFDLYEHLFDALACEEAWYRKAIPLRHPLIFYFGHTAAFFINKLVAGRWLAERLDARIEALVAIGVDEMSWDDLDERHYAWPSVAEMRAYRAKVRAQIQAFIQQMPIRLPIDWNSPAWVILMGIEHERIHLETSSVLIRQLPITQVQSLSDWPICPLARHDRVQVPVNRLLPQTGGPVRLGKPDTDQTYGWDNEYGESRVSLEPFSVSQFLVSNAEYLAFVQAGGYQNPAWWSDEGWRWRTFAQAEQPCFWVGEVDSPTRRLRLMTDEVPMPWDWPVEVNQLEAEAFCRWKAAQTDLPIRLPSEAHWYWLRDREPGDPPDGDRAPGNINLEYWASSCPVDQFKQGECYDVVGNVWQWTSTPIDGFDGFRIHALYDDFSTPTFDGQHNLIKGGSWISTGNLAIKYSRYAFRRHFFQHAGFRYIASAQPMPHRIQPYERDQAVARALDSQYGPLYFGIEPIPCRLARLAQILAPTAQRVLELGCAVGRGSFELARYFPKVDAVDFSARFIDVALRLAAEDRFRYALVQEGELLEYREARLSSLGIEPEWLARVQFSQGDAGNLKPKYQGYDLIVLPDLLDKLPEPARFLNDLAWRLQPGGVLILSSAWDWQEARTPKTQWLGGIRENGEALESYQGLQRCLAADFIEIQPAEDWPFVMRQTARLFQHGLAQISCWRRRDELIS